MIIFLDEEQEIDGVQHWMTVSSEHSDIVAFQMGHGGEIDITEPDDNNRYLSYAVWGNNLVDIHRFAHSGAKADWMGKDNEPMVIFPAGVKEHLWIDFTDFNEMVVISGGHYPAKGKRNSGAVFAHAVPKDKFVKLADHIFELYSEINPNPDHTKAIG